MILGRNFAFEHKWLFLKQNAQRRLSLGAGRAGGTRKEDSPAARSKAAAVLSWPEAQGCKGPWGVGFFLKHLRYVVILQCWQRRGSTECPSVRLVFSELGLPRAWVSSIWYKVRSGPLEIQGASPRSDCKAAYTQSGDIGWETWSNRITEYFIQLWLCCLKYIGKMNTWYLMRLSKSGEKRFKDFQEPIKQFKKQVIACHATVISSPPTPIYFGHVFVLLKGKYSEWKHGRRNI